MMTKPSAQDGELELGGKSLPFQLWIREAIDNFGFKNEH